MEPNPLIAPLQTIEKWCFVLASALIGLGMIFLSRHAGFSMSIGAAMMALNASALRRIGQRAFRDGIRPRTALLLFYLKMFIIIAMLFVCVRLLHLQAVPFVVGLSIFPVAMTGVAIRQALVKTLEKDFSHGQ